MATKDNREEKKSIKEQNPISICDVKFSPDTANIKLKDNERPGWFAILQLEPGEIAYLIEQKYRDIKKEKIEESTFEENNK